MCGMAASCRGARGAETPAAATAAPSTPRTRARAAPRWAPAAGSSCSAHAQVAGQPCVRAACLEVLCLCGFVGAGERSTQPCHAAAAAARWPASRQCSACPAGRRPGRRQPGTGAGGCAAGDGGLFLLAGIFRRPACFHCCCRVGNQVDPPRQPHARSSPHARCATCPCRSWPASRTSFRRSMPGWRSSRLGMPR